MNSHPTIMKCIPVVVSAALVLAACGSDGTSSDVAQQPADAPAASASVDAPARVAGAEKAAAPAEKAATKAAAAPGSSPARTSSGGAAARSEDTEQPITASKVRTAKAAIPVKTGGAASSSKSRTTLIPFETAEQRAASDKVAETRNGATDVGITKNSIKLGSINMHGVALGNVLTRPQAISNMATATAINDRGGVLGRQLSITDCDDGPGEVSRAKACVKKLVNQDKIFSLITGIDWATASMHDDLAQHKLPYVGAWAYSQTEWQDPYMFPTHMSMIHEAMAGAHWASNVVKPTTYALICLTSPEMQLACSEVKKIMDASGSKLVKKADISISEVSMSSFVLAMRAAAPEHIIHYVINPATMAKFMVESGQQNYYPPKGISGNHLATEVLGSIFGKHPAGRYWTNTTYKLWGPELMAIVDKYGRGAKGQVHHIMQAGYVAINVFAEAAKQVGPNLTRERLMAQLGNGTVWKSDASLDQQWSWNKEERFGSAWSPRNGQGREFMYKYESSNTVANPDASPSGFAPDPDQFVIYTYK